MSDGEAEAKRMHLAKLLAVDQTPFSEGVRCADRASGAGGCWPLVRYVVPALVRAAMDCLPALPGLPRAPAVDLLLGKRALNHSTKNQIGDVLCKTRYPAVLVVTYSNLPNHHLEMSKIKSGEWQKTCTV